MEPTATAGIRLWLALPLLALAIGASRPASAVPALELEACVLFPGCGTVITEALFHFTHENGFGQSTDPFPDDDGNGMSFLPEFPAAELFYSGTLSAGALGSSTAEFGGRYQTNGSPFDTFTFLAPAAGFELEQTDVDPAANDPALMAGTLAVPLRIVSGSGQILVTSEFDITATIPGSGTVTVDVTLCEIKNWLGVPGPGFPKSASECSGLGDATNRRTFPTFTATTGGSGTLRGRHTLPVAIADAGDWWWLVYFLDVQVENDSDPTSVVIDAIDIAIIAQDTPPVPALGSAGLALLGGLAVGLGALALAGIGRPRGAPERR